MANNIQLNAILRLIDAEVDARVLQKLSRATAGLPNALGGVAGNAQAASTQINNLAGQTNKLTDKLTASERAGRLLLQRMTQFAILLPTFVTLNRSIQGSIAFLVDFEAEINKIIALNPQVLAGKFNQISDAAFNVAETTRTSTLDAVKGIKLFSQAGFDLAKSIEFAKTSALAAKVSTLQVADAQELAIAVTKVFGDQLGSLESTFDKIVAVEDLAAVNAQDIAEAFKTGGNALAFATKSFDDTIALISALTEQTRKSGREVGTFFKTIATRITAAGEAQNAIKALGVQVTNLDGSIRPLLDILQDVKVKFDGLTESQQANAAKSIAGVRQFESFIAVLNSLDRTQQIADASAKSFGTVQAKNAIISQSISEQFAQLVVQGQKVAKALGDAGISDALVTAINAGKTFLKILEEVTKLFGKIGTSVVPLLGLFGGAGIASVLGFGGGARSLLGIGGPRASAGGPANAATGIGASANTQITQLAQVSSVASTAIGKLTQQAVLETGIDRVAFALQHDNLAILQKQFQANIVYEATIGKVNKAASALGNLFETNVAAKVAILTTAATLAAPAIHLFAEGINKLIPGTALLGDSFQKTAAAGLQTGLQFAIIGKTAQEQLKFGLLAGTIATTITSVSELKKFFEENNKIIDENNKLKTKEGEISKAISNFSSTSAINNIGEVLVSQLSKQISGLTAKDINIDKVLSNAISGSDRLKRAFEKTGEEGLKRALFNKQGVAELAKLDPSKFINQDAFKELQQSFDKNGKSTLSFAEQLQLLFKALGQVDQKVDETSGILESAFNFDEIKKAGELIQDALDLRDSSKSLEGFKESVKSIPEGVDALKIAADRASESFTIAQSQAEKLKTSLIANAPNFQLSQNQGKLIFEDIFNLIRDEGPHAGAIFADLLNGLTEDEQKFAQEAFKINKDIIGSETERFKTLQELNKEIADQTKKVRDDERNAQIAAAKSLDDFKISLLEFGVTAKDSNVDVLAVAKSFGELTDAQKKIVGAKLPADRANLESKFTEQQRAELELSNVSKTAALEIDKVNQEIGGLEAQIGELKKTGLTDAFKEAGIQNEITAKKLEIENIKRKETVDSIKAQIAVLDSQKKLNEELRKSEENRIKALEKLEQETNDFKRALRDTARAFQDFKLDRIEELTKNMGDAFKNLQDSEKDTIEKTKDVSAAYKDYITAVLEVNGAITEAQIQSNKFQNQIGNLVGGIVSFQDQLSTLNGAFSSALADANISLSKRIELEQQLANETLDFLKQAQDSIVQAGTNVFGQSAQENQQLGQGIAALSFVVKELGGSFQNFLGLGQQQLADVGKELLNLPLSLRQSILDALSALPSTFSIGGFNVDQLKQALGQVGAGVAPEVGLPSIAELTGKQVEQLQILQELAFKDAQTQFAQLATAQAQLQKTEEALAASKIDQEKAAQALTDLDEKTSNEIAVLEAASFERQELTDRIIAANDTATLRQIEEEAKLFADQNSVFRDIGKEIIAGITSAVSAKANLIEAANVVSGGYKGHFPNFSRGNLSMREAAGLLKAASIEKSHMPAGAGLAVANTSETIIPMRHQGFIPNFQNGSSIATGINAVQQTNQAAVAAISSSISQALQNTDNGAEQITVLNGISDLLLQVRDELSTISDSNIAIQTNTGTGAAATTTNTTTNDININLQTNQNQQIRVTGIDALPDEIADAIRQAAALQIEEQITPITNQLQAIIRLLRERNLISSIGQTL